jgi:hypothetical protein
VDDLTTDNRHFTQYRRSRQLRLGPARQPLAQRCIDTTPSLDASMQMSVAICDTIGGEIATVSEVARRCCVGEWREPVLRALVGHTQPDVARRGQGDGGIGWLAAR